jgi:hypothetical protein
VHLIAEVAEDVWTCFLACFVSTEPCTGILIGKRGCELADDIEVGSPREYGGAEPQVRCISSFDIPQS